MNLIQTSSQQNPNKSGLLLPCLRPGAAVAVALFLCAQFKAPGQSDNFDSYSSPADLSAAGWILSSINPALVTTTLVPVGSGKGLRIQALPYAQAQVPAVGMWYRTNEYTDFYMAIDIAGWPGTDKNQAMVMFARMTESTTGTVVNNQNPATAQGMICNYDASQYGENPGDRRQGQFQINVVNAGFNTKTLAVAEITFVPGRPYRLVFQGVGTHYTARAYDWNDLTTPLVSIEADDGTFTTGACGLLGFSRQGITGTVDCTLDNYYAGASDPNPAPAPALAHPIAGTPIVDSRVPAERWKNFFNPASAISFTANTYSANVINASATKLLLNGIDVSSKLVLSADGTNINGSLPAGSLAANTLYSAQLMVTDISGTKSSTSTFWFDTFSDAFVSGATAKVIEAEEYNFNGGSFQLDPIPVSGIDTNGVQVNGSGVGYYDAYGMAGIDYSNHTTFADASFNAFRTIDAVRTLNGGRLGIEDINHPTETDPGSDNIRSRHAASKLLEYVVCMTEFGEWLNYSRAFDSSLYTAYLRYASFGATTNELYQVTGDPTQPDQTTVKLGTFRMPNTIRQCNYIYAPLVDDSGVTALLSLSGTNTLRLQMAGTPGQDNRKTTLNYILLVQTPVNLYSSATINGAYTLETIAVVNAATRTITVPKAGDTRFYRVGSSVSIPLKKISVAGNTVTLTF